MRETSANLSRSGRENQLNGEGKKKGLTSEEEVSVKQPGVKSGHAEGQTT